MALSSVMRAPALLLVLSGSLVSCGGSGIETRLGESRIVAQLGPGGGVLRGDGGTALEGFRLVVPEGALRRLVQVTVEPGPEIVVAGTTPLSRSFSIRTEPDPGPLLEPATIALGIELPEFVRPDDLVIVSRPPATEPTAIVDHAGRIGVLSESVAYDPASRQVLAQVRSIVGFQLRRAETPRLADDALRLVSLGFDALVRSTDAALLDADQLFAQAQAADPFQPAANLFRALSRVLVVLNDRTDTGPALDSIGDAAQRLGLDVRARSLLSRARAGDWPRDLVVPAAAPSSREVIALLQSRLRPALLLALRDLDRVPVSTELIVRMPATAGPLQGDRELDAADVLLFRSVLNAAIALTDVAEDLDLDADWSTFLSGGMRGLSFAERLAAAPSFGTLRSPPDPATIAAAHAALFWWAQAFESLAAEPDPQEDDFLVLPRSFTAERFDLWRANVQALLDAFERGTLARIAFEDGSEALTVDLRDPWRGGAFDPRRYVPQLFEFLPVAGTLPDPTFGGFLPDMTQARAAELFRMASVHPLPFAAIVADGLFDDWSPGTEALLPPDPERDVPATPLRGIDLTRMWLAQDGDHLAFRLRVADGTVGWRQEQRSAYGFEIRDLATSHLRRRTVIEVVVTQTGFDVQVSRDGVPRQVRAVAAARDHDLEVVLDRFDLLDPDEPIRDRAVTVFSEALSLADSGGSSDTTRPVVVRF